MDKHLRTAHPNVKSGSTRLRPQQLKPKIPSSSANAPMVPCSICDIHVREDRWTKHVEKVHSVMRRIVPKPQKPAERSQKKVAMRQKTLEKITEEIRSIERDLKKLIPGFHRLKMEELQRRRALLLKELREYKTSSESAPTRSRGPRIAGRSLKDLEPQQEAALRQSRSEEGSYGHKYLGQVRRDYDGSFGSIPLYDDYGEELGPQNTGGDNTRGIEDNRSLR